ncbi:MAG: baseplate J/gp47 family protein [Pseudomonadota bacterium]
MTTATSLDLSRLPAPAVLEELSFAQLLAARLADFRARAPQFDALLESDPAFKLLEAGAYRELLTRGAINDSARAVMLAFATGADLDQIAARFGVTRLVIALATDATPAVLEPDADLRLRVQLAFESFASPGLTAGGYRALALRTAPELADVAVVKRAGGRIDVVLLGRDGDGTVDPAIVERVYRAFGAEDATQLTDIVSVRSATVTAYDVTLTLLIRRGPDPNVVRTAAETGLRGYANSRHRVGNAVFAGMLAAGASVGGVEHARVDIADIAPGPHGAAWLRTLTTSVEIL